MTTTPRCPRCKSDLPTISSGDSDCRCPGCGASLVRQGLTPNRFPITMRIYSGTTGELLWSRTITLEEAQQVARIDVPGYAGSTHYPVRAEIECADGTVEIGGMQ